MQSLCYLKVKAWSNYKIPQQSSKYLTTGMGN